METVHQNQTAKGVNMKTLKGIVLNLAIICIVLFVLTFDAIVSEYFYIPLILLFLGSSSFMIVFRTPFEKHTKKKAKHKKQTNHFIEYLNKTNDFYETYQYALRTPERNNNQNELATQIK